LPVTVPEVVFHVEEMIRSDPPWPLPMVSKTEVAVGDAELVVGQAPPTGVVAAEVKDVLLES
jgi:hypothetical protein